jgi:hypothetical protein
MIGPIIYKFILFLNYFDFDLFLIPINSFDNFSEPSHNFIC